MKEYVPMLSWLRYGALAGRDRASRADRRGYRAIVLIVIGFDWRSHPTVQLRELKHDVNETSTSS